MSSSNTPVLKIVCSKGTREILHTLKDRDCIWTDLMNACKDNVSLRIFNIRLRQLEELEFIGANAALNGRKAVKVYSLTEKGKKLLALIGEAEKLCILSS